MPYSMGQSKQCPTSKPWAVMMTATGKPVACHPTKEKAQAHLAALKMNVPEASKSQEPWRL